ncbi:unnamed protein product [Ectocarpus sp. 4 AP-2014]
MRYAHAYMCIRQQQARSLFRTLYNNSSSSTHTPTWYHTAAGYQVATRVVHFRRSTQHGALRSTWMNGIINSSGTTWSTSAEMGVQPVCIRIGRTGLVGCFLGYKKVYFLKKEQIKKDVYFQVALSLFRPCRLFHSAAGLLESSALPGRGQSVPRGRVRT